jgi:trigger factor
LKTEVVSQEKNIIVIKAEFEAEQVNKAIDSTIKDLSKKANIKGFRKGHVPRKTIELYFGMKGICAEALEKMVPEAIDKMIEEYELSLIAEPKLEPGELIENEPFTLQVTFEVTP